MKNTLRVMFYILVMILIASPVFAGDVDIFTKKYTQGKMKMEIPQVKGMKDAKIQKKLNKMFENDLMSFIKESKKEGATEIWNVYEVKKNADGILSLTVLESMYSEGAAHPMSYMSSYTIDMKTGQNYKLADIFQSDADYVSVINEIIKEQIPDMEIDFFEDGFKGISPDQTFYITDDALVIYFQLYEIAPYAAGFPEFQIPFGKILSIMRE